MSRYNFCVVILCVRNVRLLGFCGLILLAMKGRDKTDDELTTFGTKDIRNTSFNHAVQIQDNLFICFFEWTGMSAMGCRKRLWLL